MQTLQSPALAEPSPALAQAFVFNKSTNTAISKVEYQVNLSTDSGGQ